MVGYTSRVGEVDSGSASAGFDGEAADNAWPEGEGATPPISTDKITSSMHTMSGTHRE